MVATKLSHGSDLQGQLAVAQQFPPRVQAFLQTEQPTLTPDLPGDIACFRLLLPKGTLISEEGPEIRSVVVADVRAMEGWLPDHFALASSLLDPSSKAQQPNTDFSPTLWDCDADGVKGTAARMEQLSVHALLVALGSMYAFAYASCVVMITVSATEARKHLYALIDEVGQSHEPVQIKGKRGNAVLLSEEVWRALQETLHLVSIPGMRESILEGMATEASELSTEPGW
jgi:antitoxin YefM